MLLGEMPVEVSASGGSYLQPGVVDVTVTTIRFASGVRGHIFVSWLHPFKEQKLIVIGDKRMVVFDDVAPQNKLLIFEHKIDWIDRLPIPRKEDAQVIKLPAIEPLAEECSQFIKSIATRKKPPTDGEEGLRVLRVLEACQESLKYNGKVINLFAVKPDYFVHESSIVEKDTSIGEGTKIWHFSHIMEGATIGKNCTIGQNVFIGRGVQIGDNVKIQNNVSVFEGVILEDNVFCGPACVFTNVINPRSTIPRKNEFRPTLVKEGATIGANATIICGNTIGRFSFIGAGAVVTKDVPDFALVYGNPAKIQGWVCVCGEKLSFSSPQKKYEQAQCSACGKSYQKAAEKVYLREG
jgi:UDP-2-acetamido-3-amino-2,3-dideoxy-glucuronate N-acetyltransferase